MNIDPNGHIVLSTLLFGALIGGAIGFGATVYADYQDDGQIFNGSVKWYNYIGATILGGAIGAGLGYALPYIVSTIGAVASGSGFAFAGGGAIAGSISVSQALLAAGTIAVAGLGIMFASTNRPGDNRKQNEQYREAMRRLGYSKKDWQWRYGHDHLPNESLGFKDLLKFLRDLFDKFK